VYEFGPPGVTFAEPVQLSVRYDPEKLPAGVRDTELKLYKVISGTDWQEVQESGVVVASHTVSGLIDGFSIYGVLGVPVASVSVSPHSVTVETGKTVQRILVFADGVLAEHMLGPGDRGSSGPGRLSTSRKCSGLLIAGPLLTDELCRQVTELHREQQGKLESPRPSEPPASTIGWQRNGRPGD
jgi:hypothetical protein